MIKDRLTIGDGEGCATSTRSGRVEVSQARDSFIIARLAVGGKLPRDSTVDSISHSCLLPIVSTRPVNILTRLPDLCTRNFHGNPTCVLTCQVRGRSFCQGTLLGGLACLHLEKSAEKTHRRRSHLPNQCLTF